MVAVVTGASRGIGRAICLELAKNGIDVVVNYSGSKEKAEDVCNECLALGVKAMTFQADVSNSSQVEGMFKAVLDNFKQVDILVNNAGITKDNLIMRMSEDDFDSVIATNLKGAFVCTKAVSRMMMKQRSGKIINISSVVGVSGNAGQVNYSASKAGIIGMTKSVAKELASRGVCVNAIAPGFIRSDMTDVLPIAAKEKIQAHIPLGKMGEGEDVARLVVFLVGQGGDYITGQVICVDGGMTM